MRLPLGTIDVSESGGTTTLIARRGEERERIGSVAMTLAEAVGLLGGSVSDTPSGRFEPGQQILWRYRRVVEVATVISDDDNGLAARIPSQSARLHAVPADGRGTREVPLGERFVQPWTTAETRWRGPGITRAVPHGKPWSVWFFPDGEGQPQGVYVNLELPHQRLMVPGEPAETLTEDLVLDLWIDAAHPGNEDIWLKDADELDAAVAQGRFTPEQGDAIRALADHAVEELLAPGAWPLAHGWTQWPAPEGYEAPLALPDCAAVDAARQRSGTTSFDG